MSAGIDDIPNYETPFVAAIKDFWGVRGSQSAKQLAAGKVDAGTRGAVTGGKHLDAVAALILRVMVDAGLVPSEKRVLPGYYRRNKNWDVVSHYGTSIAAVVELKSQIGSIGNNANNRIEEMIGQAADLRTAYEKRLLGRTAPWFGYVMLVEDSVVSRQVAREPKSPARFPPDVEFIETNYIERYAIALRRLRDEQHIDQVCLVASTKEGQQSYPDLTMTFQAFAVSIHARAEKLRAELRDSDQIERKIDASTRHRIEQLPTAD